MEREPEHAPRLEQLLRELSDFLLNAFDLLIDVEVIDYELRRIDQKPVPTPLARYGSKKAAR